MSKKWLEAKATPQRVWALFKHAIVPQRAWGRVQEISGQVPAQGEWLGFADRLLLLSGTLFLVTGIFFFFAFNWAEIGKFERFALVESLVVIATLFAFVLKLDTWGGRVALMAAALLLGAALGVIGQVYQTGADSYRLFLNWTLLISGWVLISRWNMMYLLWMVLLNLTISLYWWQIIGGDGEVLNIILLGINFGFVLLWELLATRNWLPFMSRNRLHLYLLMAPALSYASYLMLDFIFGFGFGYATLDWIAPPVYAVVMGILFLLYTRLRRDLLMLSMAALSLLVVVVAGSGRLIYDLMDMTFRVPVVFFLIMGAIIVALTGGLVTGLRRIQRQWEAQS